ncbi:MAG: hypothetical protein H6657_21960 [Ardenticatenaceae bacterium]|nr:hypothetical protein [Ardenticatenaceae bacterium]
MNRYEVFYGTGEDATLIGTVAATDQGEAISTLNAYRNDFVVNDPGQWVPNPYVEWAHPDIKEAFSRNRALLAC